MVPGFAWNNTPKTASSTAALILPKLDQLLLQCKAISLRVILNYIRCVPAVFNFLFRIPRRDGHYWRLLPLMKKYGTHFYYTATLGGRLRQVIVLDSTYENTQSEFEISRSADISFAASIAGSLLSADGSLSMDLAGSLDSSTTAEQQSQFETSSSRSTVITYGGPPGSFANNLGCTFELW